jgi:phage shock protein PspC (stress-responsive transcriptional regulator)
MNEITKIHLGRQAFTIAVDAHKALREYLHGIKQEVGEKGKDVLDEVEIRMAELLISRGITGGKVVLLKDVEYLKEQLGVPEDFIENEDEAPKSKKTEKTANDQQSKQLFRDTERGMIAGVAAGLATYLRVDPVLVRIGFIALTIIWGWGILAYLILWLIIPEAKSSSNRLQMEGKAVTVANIKEAVNQADVPGATQRASRTVGRAIEKLGAVLLALFGLSFILAGIGMFLAAMTFGAYSLLNGGQVNGEIVFPVGASEVWLMLCGLLTAAVLSILILLIGVAMVRRKWPVPGWVAATLVGLFLVGGSMGTALGFHVAPDIADRVEALRRSETMPVSQFKSVTLRGEDTRFIFVPSDKYSLELSYISKKDMSESMKTTAADGMLTVDTSGFSPQEDCRVFCLYNDHNVEVIIRAPSLAVVDLEGADSSFETQNKLRQEDMKLLIDKGSFAQVNYAYPEKATVLDDESAPVREIQLFGISPGSFRNDGINVGEDFVTITRSDTFELTTTRTCEEAEPLVYLDRTPLVGLQINSVASLQVPGALEGRQNNDENNFFNCVMISQR